MESLQQFNKWSEWLKEVGNEIKQLAWVDDVFWQVQAIVGANDGINKAGRFQRWLPYTYVQTTTIGLRRLTDKSKNTQSLSRLLNNMKSNATLFSRKRFVELHDKEIHKFADEWFDELAGGNFNHIPKSQFMKISHELDDTAKLLTPFANDFVSHNSTKKRTVSFRYHDARLAIVSAFNAYKWCSRVLDSTVPTNIVPTPQSEWLHYLSVPWIKDIEEVPKYEHLDNLIEL
jgi:hypothetical protein